MLSLFPAELEIDANLATVGDNDFLTPEARVFVPGFESVNAGGEIGD